VNPEVKIINRRVTDVSVISRVEIGGVEVYVTKASVQQGAAEPDMLTITFAPSKLEILTEKPHRRR